MAGMKVPCACTLQDLIAFQPYWDRHARQEFKETMKPQRNLYSWKDRA